MAKLTPQQKEDKRRRDQLCVSNNRLLSARNFGNLSTWEELCKLLGIPNVIGHSGPLTFQELKDYIKLREENLEREITIANAPTPEKEKELREEIKANNGAPVAGESKVQGTQDVIPSGAVRELVVQSPTIPTAISTTPSPGRSSAKEDHQFSQENNYGFTPSPNETAKLFWFQKKAVAEGMDKLL